MTEAQPRNAILCIDDTGRRYEEHFWVLPSKQCSRCGVSSVMLSLLTFRDTMNTAIPSTAQPTRVTITARNPPMDPQARSTCPHLTTRIGHEA